MIGFAYIFSLLLLLFTCVVVLVEALTTHHPHGPTRTIQSLKLAEKQATPPHETTISSRKRPCACPEDNDGSSSSSSSLDSGESLEDRREALFAMMGGLWATGTLPDAFILLGQPQPAQAVYGIDAQMSFPDVVQGLSDRNTKQCLVESLGNRECLVYREDEEKLLYKGADVHVQLGRIQQAAQALEEDIPPLVVAKKWSAITGVLTGPMGQLSATLTLLVKLSEEPDQARAKAQTVKEDIFGMGTATTNKDQDGILKYQQLAVQDLALFLKSLQ